MQFLRTLTLSALVCGAVADFRVLLNGQTYQGTNVRIEDVVFNNPNTPIVVNGTHIRFTLVPATLTVHDVTLTGAADANGKRLVSKPTVIYKSASVKLTSAQIAGPIINRMRLRPNLFEMSIDVAGGGWEFVVSDAPQGMLLEFEQGFPNLNVEYTTVLGNGLFYFVNDFTGRVNIGNGINAVTSAQDPVNWHQLLLAKEAPLDTTAVQTHQDGTTSKWSVEEEGALQIFFGRDVLEPRSANCNSVCQRDAEIWYSMPIPADPADGWPLPDPRPTSSAGAAPSVTP